MMPKQLPFQTTIILEEMVEDIKKDTLLKRIIVSADPTMDLITKLMIEDGQEMLGEYDFVIEWRSPPTAVSRRELINKIDRVIETTGCRYTITTKP